MIYRIVVQLEEMQSEDENVGDVIQSTGIEIYTDKRDADAYFRATVKSAIDVNNILKLEDEYYV